MKEIKQNVIVVLFHQLLVKSILHIHVDGLMVPTVDVDRPGAGSVPGKQKNSWKVSNSYLVSEKADSTYMHCKDAGPLSTMSPLNRYIFSSEGSP